jgi:predicted ATPase/class 3 adenylate cyclase
MLLIDRSAHAALGDPVNNLPIGTVTLLFTDIEGSTRLLHRLGDLYPEALMAQRDLLRAAVAAHDGHEVDSQGDALFAAFWRASQAVSAAVDAQRALASYPWPEGGPRGGDMGALPMVRVRMGLHTGEPTRTASGYVGLDVHRAARICAAGHGGQILLSQPTAALVQDHLPVGASVRDLGAHRLKDFDRPEQVYQLIVPDLESEFPQPRTLESRPNNLTAPPTPLIGRDAEVTDARDALRRPEVRLLTLTGPAGTGKTRVGLQVAAELLEDFVDGVFFIALTAVSEPAMVAAAVAQVLGLREIEGRPLVESLKDAVRDRQLLLVLDNFEQVLGAAPFLVELLAACPRLKLLVTSRAVLRVRGEREFPLPPLALPRIGHRGQSTGHREPVREGIGGVAAREAPSEDVVAAVMQSPAVQLFIERALDVRPEFTVASETAPVIAEICARLDGLPLAIELAAARCKLLPPHALLARLENRLEVLTAGARDLPPRQQTLRGAIAWSYDLLGPGEQALFRRLAVFVGGCTLATASAVAGGGGSAPAESPGDEEILDLVGSLVDNSLLRQETRGDGEPRFVMLETIREFALERLAESEELDTARQRHALHYLALAETGEPELQGAAQGIWLARLEAEHDNLRAALGWCRECREAEVALRLAGALSRFWNLRGYVGEGRAWLEGALALPGAEKRTPVRAKALTRAAASARRQGDYARARALLEESLDIWPETGDRRGLAYALHGMGQVALHQGDYAVARSMLKDSVALFREVDDTWGLTGALGNLGDVALSQGNYTAAGATYKEVLATSRRSGFTGRIAAALSDLGELRRLQGDHERAASLYQESLALARQLGNKVSVANALHNLGHVAHHERADATAAARFLDSMALFRHLGDKRGMAACMAGLAGVAASQGKAIRAIRLLGAAEAVWEAIDARMPAPDRAEFEHNVAVARAQLDDAGFEGAWAAGRELSLEEAVAEAME